MNRKLLAAATVLLMIGGLIVASASAGSTRTYEVLVTTSVAPAALESELANLDVTRTFNRVLTGFAARLTAAEIRALEQLPEVQQITSDQKVQIDLENANRWTGVTKLTNDFGLTGDGDGFELRYSTDDVVVAVIDTGIDSRHQDLKGKVLGWQDMVNNRTQPYDDNGHGTHVSGIVAGAGRANRNLKGVAPGAALVGVKVLDQDGSGWFSDVIAGIDWVVENKDRYNIRVLKMNWCQVAPPLLRSAGFLFERANLTRHEEHLVRAEERKTVR